MKKQRQIGVRVGMPAFFVLELEDVYKHAEGAHRALAFPDFVGLLVGMGLEAYRLGKSGAQVAEENEDFYDFPQENFIGLSGKRQADFETIPVKRGSIGKRLFNGQGL
jgi:hypothetical protein